MHSTKVLLEARNDPTRTTPRRPTTTDASGRTVNSGATVDKLDFGQLSDRLGYVLRRAQVAVFKDFDVMFNEVDIRPIQYSILTLIECNPGLSQTQVCDALGIKKPNFVAMLDGLEGRGLVRRAPTPGDRRTYALFLTDEGRTLMRKLHKLAARHEQNIIDIVGADMRKLMFVHLGSLTGLRKRSAGGR